MLARADGQNKFSLLIGRHFGFGPSQWSLVGPAKLYVFEVINYCTPTPPPKHLLFSFPEEQVAPLGVI